MPSIHIPGTLLGICFVWFAIAGIGLKDLSGLLVLVTGIVWLIESLGIVGRLRR